MGKPLYLKDENGVNRISTNPGVAEVMQLLRMTEAEKSDLANALFQLEAAQPSAARSTYQQRSGTTAVTPASEGLRLTCSEGLAKALKQLIQHRANLGGQYSSQTNNAPEAIDGSMAATTDIAKIPAGSQISGPGGKRVNIRTQLQQLTAQMRKNRLWGKFRAKNRV